MAPSFPGDGPSGGGGGGSGAGSGAATPSAGRLAQKLLLVRALRKQGAALALAQGFHRWRLLSLEIGHQMKMGAAEMGRGVRQILRAAMRFRQRVLRETLQLWYNKAQSQPIVSLEKLPPAPADVLGLAAARLLAIERQVGRLNPRARTLARAVLAALFRRLLGALEAWRSHAALCRYLEIQAGEEEENQSPLAAAPAAAPRSRRRTTPEPLYLSEAARGRSGIGRGGRAPPRAAAAAAAAGAAGAGGQAEAKEDPLGGMTSEPEPMDQTMWAEPDGTTFTVRGASYLQDKIKVASPPSLFYLVAVDFFEVPKPRFHILSHPQNRVQLAAAKGATPFIFAVQIMLPGPPNYAFVAYFTPEDPDIFKQDTPFTRLAKPFFFGEDTEEMNHFRDHRFKLIPQMIEANYVVKKATGNTPAIIGTKLKQSYFRGRNYFELDLDVASSSIAARITRLAVSYSKTVTVDIGFVLQGNREEELPEQMLCAVRSAKLDITHATPLS
mmetsp:Transcript_27580/g.45553  ORF Transcript_27580/g.45553 Transcript_27580/m.45553 type:complete len:498 (-) Transcript_27580:241-1734(-)